MKEEKVPSAGYEEVYEAMGVDPPSDVLDPVDEAEDNFRGEIAAYSEIKQYRQAKRLCQELEEVFETTGDFYILMVDGEGMMPVAMGRYGEPSKVHPDFYLDSKDTNLDAVDTVFEESGYTQEMLDMFDDTTEEVPDLELEYRQPFTGDGILQGAWLAPGIAHLYDMEPIEEERKDFGEK